MNDIWAWLRHEFLPIPQCIQGWLRSWVPTHVYDFEGCIPDEAHPTIGLSSAPLPISVELQQGNEVVKLGELAIVASSNRVTECALVIALGCTTGVYQKIAAGPRCEILVKGIC